MKEQLSYYLPTELHFPKEKEFPNSFWEKLVRTTKEIDVNS